MPQPELAAYAFWRRKTRPYDAANSPDDALNAMMALLCPPGTLIPTLATTEPGDGWKLCNGQALAKSDYPRLYALLGGTFGQTSTTFNLPDLAGRFPMGATGLVALKAVGGAAAVTLTVDQLPAHGHAVTDPGHGHAFTGTPHSHTITDPGHDHAAAELADDLTLTGATADGVTAGSTGATTTGITVDAATAGGTVASGTTGITVAQTGGGQSLPVLPPYIAVNWMVRT